jgi:hypothetical protein
LKFTIEELYFIVSMLQIVRQDHPCRLLHLRLQRPVSLLRVLSRQRATRALLWRRASPTQRQPEASSPVVRQPPPLVQDRTTLTLPESCLACHSTLVTLLLSVSRRHHQNRVVVQESLQGETKITISKRVVVDFWSVISPSSPKSGGGIGIVVAAGRFLAHLG